MSTKLNVTATVYDHFHTLRHSGSDRLNKVDIFVMYGLPAALGAVLVIADVHIKGVSAVIAGVSILTGLLFALVIYVFQLRLQVANDPRVTRGGHLTTLLDELFSNVTYAVLVGLATTLVSVVAATGEAPISDTWGGGINRWWSGILAIVGVHLVFTVLMCLKRTRAAYEELTI